MFETKTTTTLKEKSPFNRYQFSLPKYGYVSVDMLWEQTVLCCGIVLLLKKIAPRGLRYCKKKVVGTRVSEPGYLAAAGAVTLARLELKFTQFVWYKTSFDIFS